jgi:hypothetical protein
MRRFIRIVFEYIITVFTMAKCLECKKMLEGRNDKKFCSVYCKSAYHYKLNESKEPSTFVRISDQLKVNRRILKKYNASGQSQIKKELLIKEGFDFNYFTHFWKAKNGNVYLFCFEFGFRDLKDGKYMLIVWQDYMKL